jgi:hypothetical protein
MVQSTALYADRNEDKKNANDTVSLPPPFLRILGLRAIHRGREAKEREKK